MGIIGAVILDVVIIQIIELNYYMWLDYIDYVFKGNIQSYEESCNVAKSLGLTSILEQYSEVTGTTREQLLKIVQDSKLCKIIDELYRPGAYVGDGGTAAILVEEYNCGKCTHLTKAIERLSQLKKLVLSNQLGLNDMDIVEALISDLEYAIGLFN